MTDADSCLSPVGIAPLSSWPVPERPFSDRRQKLVRRLVLWGAVLFFGLQFATDIYVAIAANQAQKRVDAELASRPVARAHLRVTRYQTLNSPGQGTTTEIMIEGLPAHCGQQAKPVIWSGPAVRNWCSLVLIDYLALMGRLNQCPATKGLEIGCYEGWVEFRRDGERMSFGPLTGTFSWLGLLARLIASKAMVLIIDIFAILLTYLPLELLDLIYGREQAQDSEPAGPQLL